MLTPLSGVARSGRCHLTSVLPFVSGCILLTDRSQEEPVAGFLALGSLPPLFPDSNQSKFALEIAEAASPWNPSQQLGMLCDFMTSGAADPTAELRRGIQGLQRSVGPVLDRPQPSLSSAGLCFSDGRWGGVPLYLDPTVVLPGLPKLLLVPEGASPGRDRAGLPFLWELLRVCKTPHGKAESSRTAASHAPLPQALASLGESAKS